MVVFLVILACILWYFKFDFNLNQNKEASLLISFNGMQTRKFQGEVVERMTILQALDASSKTGNFDLRYFVKDDGKVELYSIDGKTNKIGGKWLFVVNGSGIDDYDIKSRFIKNGDIIEVKFVNE
jgi:hypothetical protein